MKKLVVIDACVREGESRTWRIAAPIVGALKERYDVTEYHLPRMEGICPLTPESFKARGEGKIPAWALECAGTIAKADRILIAAPFWDMGIPAVLKAFFEQTSLFDVTFTDNRKECVGLCRCSRVLFVTTRGMAIPTGDPREQATPYLAALSSLWGLGDVTTVAATGMDYSTPEEIERKVADAIAEGLAIAKEF